MSLHLEDYIEQTHLPQFAFIKKLNLFYLKSFLVDSGVAGRELASLDALALLASNFDPDIHCVFLQALSDKTYKYLQSPYREALVYGIKHHNLHAIQFAADSFNLGKLLTLYGPALSTVPVGSYTDANPTLYTDTGYHTDIDAGKIVVLVLLLDYTEYKPTVAMNGSTPITQSLRVPFGYEAAWSNFIYAQDLLQLIKPASRSLVVYPRYNICIGYTGNSTNNWKLDSAGTGTHLSTTSLPSLTSIVTGSGPQIVATAFTTLEGSFNSTLIYSKQGTGEGGTKFVKRIWEVWSTSNFTDITIKSGNSLPDAKITLDLDKINANGYPILSVRICMVYQYCDTPATSDHEVISYQDILYSKGVD